MNRPLVLTAIGILIVIAAILLNLYLGSGDDAQEAAPPQPAMVQPAPAPEPEIACVAPGFDVVRINPLGDSVMAGTATPGARLVILDGDQQVGEAKADQRGEWVFVPTQTLEPGTRRLTLSATVEGCPTMTSDQAVVLVVPERGEGTLALKVPEGEAPVSVMQRPGDEAIGLSIDVVDYDADGKMSLSGHALPGATVRLYLDNDFLGATESDDGGVWLLAPETRAEVGLHTIRADHVDDQDKVLARVSIPFQRSTMMTEMEPGTYVVVQPGNSLWRLARKTYGDGTRFAVIYQANREQIANPDMIYPGQIFTLPRD